MTNQRNGALDALRVGAILLVFTRHYPRSGLPELLSPLAHYGWVAIDLFFVLSAFLITSQLVQGMSIKEFYIRRALRILPLYWFTLALYFFVPGFSESDGMAPGWKFLAFVQNFGLYPETQAAFSHAWSLCVEEHFYLILCPLLLVLIRGVNRRNVVFGFAAFLGFEAILRWMLWSPDFLSNHAEYLRHIYYPTYTHLDGLAVGALIAFLNPTCWSSPRQRQVLFGIGALILALAAGLAWNQHTQVAVSMAFSLTSIGFGFWVLGASKLQWTSRFWSTWAWWVFPAYLIHKPILKASVTWSSSPWVNYGLSVAAVFAVAFALHVVIERPCLALRDRWVARYTRA